MIYIFKNAEYDIPNTLIDKYVDEFSALKQFEMREELDSLRNLIYHSLHLVNKEPKLLDKNMHREDFITIIAMKEALNILKMLHDA